MVTIYYSQVEDFMPNQGNEMAYYSDLDEFEGMINLTSGEMPYVIVYELPNGTVFYSMTDTTLVYEK